VNEWITALYEKKFGSRGPASDAPAAPEDPWPDRPEIPELAMYEEILADDDDGDDFHNRFARPSEEDLDEQNTRMLRRQCLFRWAAQHVAIAMSTLPEVQKVAAFGAVPGR
jgi:hypothetical protein